MTRMQPLDDGTTFVDPLDVVVVESKTYFYELTRKQRKAGLIREDVENHYVSVTLRSGNVVSGRFLGRGVTGALAASSVMETLMEAIR